MNVRLAFENKVLEGEVTLPASKSISNRVLIINALSEGGLPIKNLSDCDDTRHMLAVLQSDDCRFDVGHAGTAMRFLTAFLSRIAGRWEITGSARMCQRPIGVLVDALNKLGARIEYTGRTGYPPLRIYGSFLKGGEIEIPASISSQYISALLMIAPYMGEGLKLTLTGKIVSRTYIDMTLALMKEFGADAGNEGNRIEVKSGSYRPVVYEVESDWSGASYFYELLAVAGKGKMVLPGLYADSLQGDARQAQLWQKLGITTSFGEKGAVIENKGGRPEHLEYDFTEMPDLVQSFAVACCLLEVPFVFSGLETLRIKETDRIEALTNESKKLGYVLELGNKGELMWKGKRRETERYPEIATYDDHRMAMAFAPAALKFPGLIVLDKEVVSKSFPDYWEQLSVLGFECLFSH